MIRRGDDLAENELECKIFLASLKRLIENGSLDFVLRRINKETLSNLGISIDDAIYSIRELTIDNYCRGPVEDHQDGTQMIWEFGIEDFFFEADYPYSSLYIKIVIRPSKNDMVVISFHAAKFAIVYPLKNKNY